MRFLISKTNLVTAPALALGTDRRRVIARNKNVAPVSFVKRDSNKQKMGTNKPIEKNYATGRRNLRAERSNMHYCDRKE